jgi:hypothetical protein
MPLRECRTHPSPARVIAATQWSCRRLGGPFLQLCCVLWQPLQMICVWITLWITLCGTVVQVNNNLDITKALANCRSVHRFKHSP